MDKMDEKIVVFRSVVLDILEGFPGVAAHHLYPQNMLLFTEAALLHLEIKRRGDVEADANYLQVIPYVILTDPYEHTLMYNRGNQGGEERLKDRWSIGIGGHANPEDGEGKFPPKSPWSCAKFLNAAAYRELTEELEGIPAVQDIGNLATLSLCHVAFLYSKDSPVDEVHFGIVMKAMVSNKTKKAIKPRNEIKELRWVAKGELLQCKLESWSEKLRLLV